MMVSSCIPVPKNTFFIFYFKLHNSWAFFMLFSPLNFMSAAIKGICAPHHIPSAVMAFMYAT